MGIVRLFCCVIAVLFTVIMAVGASPIHVGMALDTAHMRTEDIDSALDAAQSSGIDRITITADWAQIQPKQDSWNFAKLDALIAAAQQRKLDIVLVPGPAPRWTVTYLGKNPSAVEVSRARPDLNAYREFMSGLARRYEQKVTYFQLWERPNAKTLLARPADVYALYREGARAVHDRNPSLRTIIVEPGDVNMNWIADYLRTSIGSSRADIIALAPVHTNSGSLQPFAWHIQALHDRVLHGRDTPQLWVDATASDDTLPFASIALLEGISNVTFAQHNMKSATDDNGMASPRFLSRLRNTAYLGWVTPSHDVIGGMFGDTRENRYLLLLSTGADSTVQVLPSTRDDKGSIIAEATDVTVYVPGSSSASLPVRGETPLAIPSMKPVIVAGVHTAITPGVPSFAPQPVATSSVSLDLSGIDPSGIHPLPDLPGGQYSDYNLMGHHIISTLRDEQPWLHFDVPDGFLFYNTQRIPVEVTVTVLGVLTREKSGFNLYYDAVGGMRNTSWQWINTGTENEFSYTFRLNDALFAGSEGYDFRVNMGGSDENVRVIGVTIKKVSSGTASVTTATNRQTTD
ncbi:MAG TPA: beta-galactosidase [Armatimonadota bacterium]|nr:beta-galactosidase [Armatimonadota bacterium]